MNDRLPSPDDWSEAARAGEAARDVGGPAQAVGGMAPITARLPAALLQQIVDAARAGLPNEACGLLAASEPAGAGGLPSRYVPLTNSAASPYRYLIDPQEQLRVMLEMDEADEVVWGIVHSHVKSAAVPSVTDVGLAYYPDSLYLICSLAHDEPVIRGWSIRDGEVVEVPLAVT